MLLALVVYLVFYYITIPFWPQGVLWAALLLFMISRGIFQTFLFRKHGFELN